MGNRSKNWKINKRTSTKQLTANQIKRTLKKLNIAMVKVEQIMRVRIQRMLL